MWNKAATVLLFGVLSFVLLGMGFGGSKEDSAAYKKISADQARAMMDNGDSYVLLDVRTQKELEERHIQGAVLIPYVEIQERAPSELPDRDALILVYCRSGRRSAIAAKDLGRMGYTRVYDFGGINDWPYDIVTDAGNAKQ